MLTKQGRLTTTAGDPTIEKHMRESHENLKSMGQDAQIRFVEGRQQIEELVPQLKAARGLETWKGSFNPYGGWVHARKSLEHWGVASSDMGVKFLSGAQGTMTGLKIGADGQLSGIRVLSGETLCADRYILATGAASPQVVPELLAPHLWSKCWTLAHAELSDEEVQQ
jgi:sarcosine oxidase/L-pipecolate oxidase